MKKLICIIVVSMMILPLCACKTFSANEAEGPVVAENLCIRDGDGINSQGKITLNSEDFVNIGFSPDKQESDVLNITFEITDKGKEKFSEATKKAAGESGYLSLWVGDEVIFSNKVSQQITDNLFILQVGGLEDKEYRNSIMYKLKGIFEE